MPEHDDFYTLAHIDEQVDALWQVRGTPTRDQRLAADLRDILANEQEDVRSLHTVLQKLRQETGDQPSQTIVSISEQYPTQGRLIYMHNNAPLRPTRQMKPIVRVLSTLAAVLVMAVLIGSLLLILHASQRPASQLPTAHSGEQTPTPIVNQGEVVYHSNLDAESIAWSPDSQRIAEANLEQDGTWQVRSWDALTGQHVVTYPLHKTLLPPPLRVTWSPDGKSLAVADSFGKVYLFDAQSGKLIHTFVPSTEANIPVKVAWSVDNKDLIEITDDKTLVWNALTGSFVRQIAGGDGDISPQGNLLAIHPCEETILHCPEIDIWDTSTWQIVKRYPNADVWQYYWSPDGQQLVMVDSSNRYSVRIIDALTGQIVSQFTSPQKRQLSEVIWSPDGNRLMEIYVTQSSSSFSTNVITIVNAATGTPLYTFPSDGKNETVSASWSPDGKYIACSQDILDARTNTTQSELVIWIA
jgi:WD40 repeat protein